MPFPNLNGRPVEYTDDVPSKVDEYVKICNEEKNLPTRAGLALYIGVSKKTVWEWEKKYPQLGNALAKYDNLQEDEVLQKSLKGEYNANIAKLVLYNHGYSDKSEVKQDIKAEMKVDDLTDPQSKLELLKARIAEHEAQMKSKGDDSAKSQ